ncbi:type II restriction enzyme [Desulfitobacterium hafniense]|uniref:type II restriction enzyme n=1 Tax=Desulfitobacterium hafniense TaxID=49338 RepID=UPI00396A8A9D
MSEHPKSQNDQAWESLFKKYDILSRIEAEGKFTISASQIKEYREPRLMAKFDHNINLPRIFARNRLAILPISRGDYIISHFEAYQPFSSVDTSVTRVSLPPNLQSLSASHIPSEAIAVNCALASGMLADFLEEKTLYATVSGRMGSGQFDFTIRNLRTQCPTEVAVSNSQIEIDAALEGVHSLSLLEAKRDLAEDFLVRQLYYPFRVWSGRVTKQVRPIFLVYSNGIFSLYEYEFQDPNAYNSLVLVKHKNYSIEDTAIGAADLHDVAERTQLLQEPEIPFPQANSFERVINICELLSTQELSREQVTEEYAFDIRQTNYYTDAARYLGLVEKRYEEGRKPVYSLSSRGKRIMQLSYQQRQLAFCEAILQHRVFRETFKLYMENGSLPDQNTIVSIMQQSDLYQIGSMSTFVRRSTTVSGWLNWMLGLIGEEH